jgi:hypothetical protein
MRYPSSCHSFSSATTTYHPQVITEIHNDAFLQKAIWWEVVVSEPQESSDYRGEILDEEPCSYKCWEISLPEIFKKCLLKVSFLDLTIL